MKKTMMAAVVLAFGFAAGLSALAAPGPDDTNKDVRMPPIVIRIGDGTELEVSPYGKGEPGVIAANPKAARFSERVKRKTMAFPVVRGAGLEGRCSIVDGVVGRYRRILLSIKNTGKAPVIVSDICFMRDWVPGGVRDGVRSGNTDGSVAVFPSRRLFVGVEHPMSKLSVENGGVSAHLPRDFAMAPGEEWNFAYVVGHYSGETPRRDFQAYLDAERAHPYRVIPHYNSWYDLNIGRNDLPWQKRMDEAEALGVMKAFRSEMGKRGVFIQSYLWDDGWDEWNSLWDFHPGFPNGFAKLAEESHRDKGASIGCWMSPCGGYGASQAARVVYSRAKGYIGQQDNMLKMSNPTYYAAFRDRVIDMIRRYDMNLFKFDRMGNGRDSNGCDVKHAPEMDAIVRLLGEMRNAKQDVFVNCTVGTWASPFWVMYADSIWRGGDDFDTAGSGTERQKWLTYRDNKIHDRFVAPCPLFPLNSMMMHGIIVSKFGPPGRMDRSNTPQSTQDFADEVWMGVGCGTGLQEYYITPGLMHREWWDILAAGVKWLKANEGVLRDVHWIGGDPVGPDGRGAVYGYASAGEGKGVIAIRNSASESLEFSGKLARLLDLPDSTEASKPLSRKIVYSHGAKIGEIKSREDVFTVNLEPHGMALIEFAVKYRRDAPRLASVNL